MYLRNCALPLLEQTLSLTLCPLSLLALNGVKSGALDKPKSM